MFHQLWASTTKFSDQCLGARKYLEADWNCTTTEDAPEQFACEDEWLEIKCPAGKYIDIISANYGRKVK